MTPSGAFAIMHLREYRIVMTSERKELLTGTAPKPDHILSAASFEYLVEEALERGGTWLRFRDAVPLDGMANSTAAHCVTSLVIEGVLAEMKTMMTHPSGHWLPARPRMSCFTYGRSMVRIRGGHGIVHVSVGGGARRMTMAGAAEVDCRRLHRNPSAAYFRLARFASSTGRATQT